MTFGGKESAKINAGDNLISDEISIDMIAHNLFFVSFYLGD
ncbi:MAG: hypothetical protein ACI4C0_07655 [Lachnospiraceae bacterium]